MIDEEDDLIVLFQRKNFFYVGPKQVHGIAHAIND